MRYMTNSPEPTHWPEEPTVESDSPGVEDEYPRDAQSDDLPLEADAVDVLEQRTALDDDVEDIAAGDWAE
jgi:hypothetical protein